MTPAIVPHRFRWDWFEVTKDLGATISEAPGVQWMQAWGKFVVHRTHLPLLGEAGCGALVEHHKMLWSGEERSTWASEQGVTLRPHQVSGLDFLSSRRGVLVGDSMRLGKTCMSLLAHDFSTGPLVVLAPLSTRSVWIGWMKKLWPDIEPVVITGLRADPDQFKDAQIIFGHYDILTHHRLASLRPGTLILDEAHLLSNSKSLRTDSVFFYAGVAHRVILLSGTPLWNTSVGLWSLLAAANPGAWGNKFAFSQRYCQPEMGEYGWKYLGISNEAEWHKRRSEMMIARKWSEVARDLPPIQYNVEIVDLDSKTLRELDLLAYELRKNAVVKARVEDLNYYRQATGLFKVPLAVDLTQRFLREENDVVAWVWHRHVGERMRKELAKKLRVDPASIPLVTGEDSVKKRDELIDRWKCARYPGPLIIGIDVGQVGIDLSRAPHEIFVEIDWTPVAVSQALMRIYDPTRPMSVTFLLLNHEIDIALLETLRRKVIAGDAMGMPAAGDQFVLPIFGDAALPDDELLRAFSRAVS